MTGSEYKSTFIMADGAPAIYEAIRTTFGNDVLQLMCYFHVKKSVEARLKSLAADICASLESDLDLPQLTCCSWWVSPEEFYAAAQLFISYWTAHNDPNVVNVANYIQKECITTSLSNWFEGASPAVYLAQTVV